MDTGRSIYFIRLPYFYGAGQYPECKALRYIENKDVGRTYAPEKAFYQLIDVVRAANPEKLEYIVALTEACLLNEHNLGERGTQRIKKYLRLLLLFIHALSVRIT